MAPEPDRPLGVVVAGTSFGCLTHVPALRAAGFVVRGLVGHDAARTRERADILGIEHAGTSLTDALGAPGVDAVSIATPPHTHGPLVLEALAAGKHVVCEKPFAADAAEAERLCDAADAAGVVNLVGHELRWLPANAALEQAVRDELIGPPRLATVIWLAPALAAPGDDAPEWWTDAGSGGGWLGAHGSHVVDHLRATLGEIDAVSGGLTVTSDHAWSADDTYTFRFRTRGGAEGLAQSSYATYGPLTAVTRVSGPLGTVWIEGNVVSPAAEAWIADAAGTRRLPIREDLAWEMPAPLPDALIAGLGTKYGRNHATGATIPAYTALARDFRDLILGREVVGPPRPPTFRDGLAHMRVLDAIRRASADGGGWVPVTVG